MQRSLARLCATAERKTVLYDFHRAHGGKMVPFAGWSMPVQYTAGLLKEHHACRNAAAIFDVSHMAQLRFYGPRREEFFEHVSCADIKALPMGKGRLSCLMNHRAGLIDDIIVTRFENHLGVVVNAGRTKEDLAHFRAELAAFGAGVELVHDEGLSLIALQGPKAAEMLTNLGVEHLDKLYFSCARPATIKGIDVHLCRCGYTGEDGFEISVPHKDAVALAELLVAQPGALLAGLGARDSLRLEAGLCLYGHELNEDVNVVEAGLQWLITKRRLTEGGFIGSKALMVLKSDPTKTPTRRVGIRSKGVCARENTDIVDDSTGKVIGKVTSGCPSPSLGGNVHQAYVPVSMSKPGTSVTMLVRGKTKVEGEVTKMPFVPTHYYNPPASA